MKLKMYINNQPISQYKTEICLTSLYKPPTSYKFNKKHNCTYRIPRALTSSRNTRIS